MAPDLANRVVVANLLRPTVVYGVLRIVLIEVGDYLSPGLLGCWCQWLEQWCVLRLLSSRLLVFLTHQFVDRLSEQFVYLG